MVIPSAVEGVRSFTVAEPRNKGHGMEREKKRERWQRATLTMSHTRRKKEEEEKEEEEEEEEWITEEKE